MPKLYRPARRAIPVAVKRAVCARQGWVCKCGCGQPVSEKSRTGTKFDHRPPLALRDVLPDGSDYIPPQHSVEHLDAICDAEHHRRTHGTGATVAGSDIGMIKKERRRAKRRVKEAKKAARSPWRMGRKIKSAGFRRYTPNVKQINE